MKTATAAPVLLLALALFAGTSELSAQGSNPDGRSTATDSSTMRPLGGTPRAAPHQQPRAGDAPRSESSIDQLSAEDKALDRKLRGICRGC
jgi:hypothetical protein